MGAPKTSVNKEKKASSSIEIGSGLFHPLNGADFKTFFLNLYRHGGVDKKFIPQLLFTLFAMTSRWPFTMMEKAWASTKRKKMKAMPAPVFIIGHWRSGTTHLHNIMVQSQNWGYLTPIATGIPWEMWSLGQWVKPWANRQLPKDRGFDSVAVTPHSPQEDEMALASMHPLSLYNAVYFPRHFEKELKRSVFWDNCNQEELKSWKECFIYLWQKVFIEQKCCRLLIKNPVYSTRIPFLQSIWPEAKFIHIYRNPYHVFPSTMHFFKSLFPVLSLQEDRPDNLSEIVFETYSRMMNQLIEDSTSLSSNRYAEVCFEDLESQPMKVLQKIYSQLELEGFEQSQESFQTYLNQTKTYRKNTYSDLSQSQIEQIKKHWGPFIERWGYDRIEKQVKK